MNRSFIRLRRVLLGVSGTVVFGFGATLAFGSPDQARRRVNCDARGYDYASYYCQVALGCDTGGYCAAHGFCMCGDLP